MSKTLVLMVAVVFLGGCSQQNTKNKAADFLQKDWRLNVAASQFSFISTKNQTHNEEHTIKFASGFLNRAQQFQVVLDLNSVDTMIPIRDERMRTMLFNTEKYPTATISTTVPSGVRLKQVVEVPFELNLHGKTQTLTAQMLAEIIDEQLVIISYEPVAVNSKTFGMDMAINQFTQIAGLQSIDYTALVEFKLTFEK